MCIRSTAASFVCVITLGLLCCPLQADDKPTTVQPDTDTFVEKYDETVDVAGQLRAGLMYGSTLNKVDVKDLRMDLSLQNVTDKEVACVRVASRNGAFSATWKVTLRTDLLFQVITNFPTEHQDVLESYDTDELVAIASVVALQEPCAVSGGRYLPTSWGDSDRKSINTYLNADSTEARIAGRVEGGIIQQPCRSLPVSGDNVAFDTVCTLNLKNTGTDSEPVYEIPTELAVVRKSFSSVTKNIRYPLSTK